MDITVLPIPGGPDKDSLKLSVRPDNIVKSSKRICIISTAFALISVLITLAVLLSYSLVSEPDFEPPNSEIYTVTAKISIETIYDEDLSSTTTYSTLDATIFALHSSPQMIKLLLAGGIIQNDGMASENKLKAENLFYFEVDSKTGQILKMIYEQSEQNKERKSVMKSCVSTFMVNSLDSEYEKYSSKCKHDFTTEDNIYCVYYKKHQEDKGVVFSKKYDEQQAKFASGIYNEENVKLNVESQSFVSEKSKKVESSTLSSELRIKLYNDAEIEKNLHFKEFNEFKFSFFKKISEDELEILDNVVDELIRKYEIREKSSSPGVTIEIIEDYDEISEKDENFKIIIENEKQNHKNDRKLLSGNSTNNAFKVLGYDLKLVSQLDEFNYPNNSNKYLCVNHTLSYFGRQLPLQKKRYCMTSDDTKLSSRKKIGDLTKSSNAKFRFDDFDLGFNRMQLEMSISSTSSSYISIYKFDKNNRTAELVTESSITLTTSGQFKEKGIPIIKADFKEKISTSLMTNMFTGIDSHLHSYRAGVQAKYSGTLEIKLLKVELNTTSLNFFGIITVFPNVTYNKGTKSYKTEIKSTTVPMNYFMSGSF